MHIINFNIVINGSTEGFKPGSKDSPATIFVYFYDFADSEDIEITKYLFSKDVII